MRALILFAHGARDPRWAEPFERLRLLAQAQLPDTAVHLAFLELMQPALPDLIAQLAGTGCTDATVVPVFLGQGGHVRRDLPALIETLREKYPALRIGVATAVGEDEAVLAAIAQYCVASAG
jgi:sirohydrochlorin cobaltochelatase